MTTAYDPTERLSEAYASELLRGAGIAIHPEVDGFIVDAARTRLLEPMRADGYPPEYVAEITVQYLAEQVAGWRRDRERREVAAAVRGIGPQYDREQEQAREIEASNERQSRAYREWDQRVAGGVR